MKHKLNATNLEEHLTSFRMRHINLTQIKKIYSSVSCSETQDLNMFISYEKKYKTIYMYNGLSETRELGQLIFIFQIPF